MPYDPTLDWDYVLGGSDQPTYSNPVFSTTPPFVQTPQEQPGFANTWLGPLLAGAEKTISNIFAPAATSIAQAQGSSSLYQPYNYPAGAPQPIYRAPQTGVGLGVDSRGIRLSDGSYIGWGVIALVGGVILLIQTRPFSRR